jgi:hypothetical protein
MSNDRVSIVEQRVAVLEEKMEHFDGMIGRMEGKQNEIVSKQDQILSELSRYKGVAGGVILTVSFLIAVISQTKEWLMRHLFG